MRTVQGDFETQERAREAQRALVASGVPAGRIRVWNIIPEGGNAPSGSAGTAAGALAGAAFGGVGGLVTGAILGAAVDGAADAGRRLPPPCGARVVVDAPPDMPDPAAVLRGLGAANVRETGA